MNQLIPPALLFEYRFQVPVCPDPSGKKRGRLLQPADLAQLPALSAVDGGTPFASLSAGWNPNGLAVCLKVRGRTTPPAGNSKKPEASDCVELWIDTRPTGNVHRATGYCHRLACLAVDENADGAPVAVPQPIPQQREVRADMQPRHLKLRTHTQADGYDLEIWIPASQLYGYDQIDELRQLGFYSLIRDTELGDQPLTVTDDFPFNWDPSLWVQLELTGA